MNKRIVLKPVVYILVVIIMLNIAPTAFAHPSSQEGILAKTYHAEYGGYYIGGETVGWSINEEQHTNGTTITYSFLSSDTNLTSKYKSYVTDGASKWSGTVTIVNKTDGSGTGIINTYSASGTGVVARTVRLNCDSSGHYFGWRMEMNLAYTQTAAVLAHEFGHVIGLNDLYESSNSGKIMYGIAYGPATAPTALDKWGAKVITGVHTTHTWGYKYHSTTSTGVNRHVKYCTSCKGLTSTIANCVYNANNVCKICGVSAGSQPWSVPHEIE